VRASAGCTGYPPTIKDLLPTKDMPTQRGSKIFAGDQPTEDTPIVPRLQDEGRDHSRQDHDVGVRLDRRFAQPAHGHHQQPMEARLQTPAASSAGAGAAAAAGYGPLHQGSDGAGSIRMPSHFCGVFGLKPSFGPPCHIIQSASAT